MDHGGSTTKPLRIGKNQKRHFKNFKKIKKRGNRALRRNSKYANSDSPRLVSVFKVKDYATKYDRLIRNGTINKEVLKNQIMTEFNDLIELNRDLPAFEKMLTISKNKLIKELER